MNRPYVSFQCKKTYFCDTIFDKTEDRHLRFKRWLHLGRSIKEICNRIHIGIFSSTIYILVQNIDWNYTTKYLIRHSDEIFILQKTRDIIKYTLVKSIYHINSWHRKVYVNTIMECPHITQGQTVSLTLKELTSIIKGGVKCGGMYSCYKYL